YLIFRYNIKNEFEADNTLASALSDNVLNPRIIDTLKSASEDEFNIEEERVPASPAASRYATLTPDDRLILKALEIALDAQEVITGGGQEADFEHPYIPEPDPVPEVEKEPEPEEAPVIEEESAGASEPETKEVPEKPARVKVKIHTRKAARRPVRIPVRLKKDGEKP
ncbi:MAG: hypothetical protein J6T73_00370, partial [Clostridia bacterium]|nr:hypothetical protein [Clostridia bacterium]